MAIKKSILLVCDGPCGTTIEGARVPKGWSRAKVGFIKHEDGDKAKALSVYLCPSCTRKLIAAMEMLKFAFTELNFTQPGPTYREQLEDAWAAERALAAAPVEPLRHVPVAANAAAAAAPATPSPEKPSSKA